MLATQLRDMVINKRRWKEIINIWEKSTPEHLWTTFQPRNHYLRKKKKCKKITEIEQQTKYSIAFIRNKRLEWFGHTWSCYGLLIKKVLVEKINKTRPLGRPRTRWIDVINRHLREIGQNNLEKPLSWRTTEIDGETFWRQQWSSMDP